MYLNELSEILLFYPFSNRHYTNLYADPCIQTAQEPVLTNIENNNFMQCEVFLGKAGLGHCLLHFYDKTSSS